MPGNFTSMWWWVAGVYDLFICFTWHLTVYVSLCRLSTVFLRTTLSDELLPAPAKLAGFPDDQCCRYGGVFRAHLENDVSSLPPEIGGVGVTKYNFQALSSCLNLLGETCGRRSLTYKGSWVSSATEKNKKLYSALLSQWKYSKWAQFWFPPGPLRHKVIEY